MKIKQTIKKIEKEIEKIQDNYEMGNKEEWDKEELLKSKLSGYKLALKDILSEIDGKLNWIAKEVEIQPTDRGIQHLKSQIISYIIPQAKEELKKMVKTNERR